MELMLILGPDDGEGRAELNVEQPPACLQVQSNDF